MVNRVILIGNLGKDPEVRRLESGAVVAKFPMATNENYRDRNGEWQSQTEWHDIVTWRALAERVENSFKKGMLVYVEGKLTHRTWQDQDGNNRRTTEVVASYLRIINNREGGSLGQQGSGGYFPDASDEPATATKTNTETPVNQGADNSTEDDLPF